MRVDGGVGCRAGARGAAAWAGSRGHPQPHRAWEAAQKNEMNGNPGADASSTGALVAMGDARERNRYFPCVDSGSECDGEEDYDAFAKRLIHRGKVRLGSASSDDESSESSESSESTSSSSGSDGDSSDDPTAGLAGEALDAIQDALRLFDSFEDLKVYAESLMKCPLSNNKRTTNSPPKWMKEFCPEAKSYWMNGTLYCMKARCDHDTYVPWAKTTCTCYMRYSMCQETKKWRMGTSCLSHNHELEKGTAETPSGTGMTHYRSALALDQDMIRTIHCWLDAKIGERSIALYPYCLTNCRHQGHSISFQKKVSQQGHQGESRSISQATTRQK